MYPTAAKSRTRLSCIVIVRLLRMVGSGRRILFAEPGFYWLPPATGLHTAVDDTSYHAHGPERESKVAVMPPVNALISIRHGEWTTSRPCPLQTGNRQSFLADG